MILEKVKTYLGEIEKNNKKGKKINAILQVNPNVVEEAKELDKKKGKGKLYGKVIAVKSNINVKSLNASCASKTLENYTCPYNATVIEKIKKEGGLIIGMCNMDEFACGSSGETSAFGACKNPKSLSRIPGGSSSGSAAAVAANFCDMALGSDTGGSIRNPSSNCGVVGVKSSYGLVSRYGLIDLSMSLEQIGPIAKNVEDAMLLLNVIRGKDEKDATTYESKEIKFQKLGKVNIGVPKIKVDTENQKFSVSQTTNRTGQVVCDKNIKILVDKKINNISRKNKWKVKEINLPHIQLGVETYYPICYTEFFSGTRKFDGRRYGKKIEDSCGEEVLRRILGGGKISQAEYKGKYYRKALQAKALIKKEFENAFKDVDCIIIPVLPVLPWKLGEKMNVEYVYASDALTVLANLAEIPAISVPAGEINGIPVGLQILCPRFEEGRMFSLAKEFKNI